MKALLRHKSQPLLGGLLLIAWGSVGCATQPVPPHQGGLGPLVDDSGQRRSLVMTSPQVASLSQMQPWLGEPQAWYLYRNDRQPRVASGYQSPTVVRSVTYTRDGQSIYGDRIRDNYQQRSYRTTYQEAVR
jgi:hypothetical protein